MEDINFKEDSLDVQALTTQEENELLRSPLDTKLISDNDLVDLENEKDFMQFSIIKENDLIQFSMLQDDNDQNSDKLLLPVNLKERFDIEKKKGN